MNQNKIGASSEDYLEAIYKLQQKNETVRSVDIASLLQVSRPSVNKALGVLRQAQMIQQQPYGKITLTQKGEEKAAAVCARHGTIKDFLISILGVTDWVAEEDACKMEHVVSEETMKKLTAFIRQQL